MRHSIAVVLFLAPLTASADPQPVVLDAGADSIALVGHLEILEDASGMLGRIEVSTGAISEGFAATSAITPNYGWTRSAWWVRFRVVSEEASTWLLEFDWPIVDHVELFSSGQDGTSRQIAGDSLPLDEWASPERIPVFRLAPEPGVVTTYTLRVAGDDTMAIPLSLWRPEAHGLALARQNLGFGFVYGALVILALYNLLVYVRIGDASHLAYSVMVGSFAIYQLCFDGFLFQALARVGIHQPQQTLCVLGGAAIISTAVFTRRFFDGSSSGIAKGLLAVEASTLALTLYVVFGDPMIFQLLISVPAFAGAILCLAYAITARRRGYGPANHYLIGFGGALLGGIVFEMRGVGLLPSTFFTHHALRIGVMFSTITFSLGLADRIRSLQQDLAQKQREKAAADLLARELDQQRRAAESSDLAKSRFLSTASHDLRQPLHALGFFARTLAEQVHDEPARTTVKRLESTVAALSNMLTSLLDMSRIEARKLEPVMSTVPLQALLSRLASEFEPEARERGLDLVLEQGDFTVRTDPTLLGRVIQNLLSNAVRYTPTGTVTLSTRVAGDDIEIRVSDSGPGISLSDQRVIFDEFVQLANGEDEGLGLGLAIVDRLTKLLGHELRIEAGSTGTTFSIFVPRVAGHDGGASLPPLKVDFAGRLAVVIDDELDVLTATHTLLEGWGFEVVMAQDAEAALEGLDHLGRDPDIVLADYRLAHGRKGTEAIDLLRAAASKPFGAVIVTGETLGEIHRQLLDTGLPLLTKPLAPHKLRAMLIQLVRSTR